MGTARMGDDPSTSVVDRWCRAHDVPNLYIADSSVFVTSAGLNPSLTITALALRVADRIAATRGDPAAG
jgi:choline dehydrogenase-like flavoprotein